MVVPQTIVVHDGAPTDSTAKDYYVPYRDYIKNVASSEIYSTWPQSTITANVLAIMSFTLNRVYTEWYRNQGYDFTITSSTAFDHKWIYGRNIFESISQVVDEIFDSFLSRPGVRQPILTQYCDGRQVQCPRWMTQWGSCSLGQQGYSPIEILRYYYGDSIYINTAEQIAGIPASWPGYDLTVGSSGDKVRQLQEQLDAIAQIYTAIPASSLTASTDSRQRLQCGNSRISSVCPRQVSPTLPPGIRSPISMWGSHGSQSCIDHAFHTFLPPLWAAGCALAQLCPIFPASSSDTPMAHIP